MRRLLLVTHRPIHGAGGAVARWRGLVPLLGELGWAVDVVAASDAPPSEFDPTPQVARRARRVAAARAVADPMLGRIGLRSSALTPSTRWAVAGGRAVRAALTASHYDVVYATAPPIAGLAAARLGLRGHGTPFVAELRDLWAGNPAYETRPGRLDPVEHLMLARADAIVAVTPEAEASLRLRHPDLSSRVATIPNGFDLRLLDERTATAAGGPPRTLVHSGTLTADRPLQPLLDGLARRPAGRLQLVLHGYLAPEVMAEVGHAPAGADVVVMPPSSWEEAIRMIAAADVCVVTQSARAGDATAVAGKVYEYLALGKPTLCLSDGGATDALLRRLDAAQLSVPLDDAAAVDDALARIEAGRLPPPVPVSKLVPYARETEARQVAELLGALVAK